VVDTRALLEASRPMKEQDLKKEKMKMKRLVVP
jgi:hypothetical protein